MDRRVAVTGIGAVTPVGNSAEATWEALKAGRSGVTKIDTFDATTFPVQIAGTVKGFDIADHVPDPADREHLSRAAGFGVAAALEALKDAGIDGAYEPHEIDASAAEDPRNGRVLCALLEKPPQRGRLLPDLAQQNGIGDVWSRSRLGHRGLHQFPPLCGTNTGVEPDRSRRLSSETSR